MTLVTIAKSIFIVILSITLFIGVSVISGQWSVLHMSLQDLSNRVIKIEATSEANQQRIQNQHVRISALESHSKEIAQLLMEIRLGTNEIRNVLEKPPKPPPRVP